MGLFHAGDGLGRGGCSRVQFRPDQFVFSRVVVVERGRDEFEVSADDGGSRRVAGLDVPDQPGSIVQLVTEHPMGDCHIKRVRRHNGSFAGRTRRKPDASGRNLCAAWNLLVAIATWWNAMMQSFDSSSNGLTTVKLYRNG